jgi:hypothetical protein
MAERNEGRGSLQGVNRLAVRPVAWWARLVVIVGALLTAMGAIIALVHPAMLVSPQDEITGAVHIYAGYLAARNLAIAFLLLTLLFLGLRRSLGNLMVLVAMIQLLDACMDVVEGRWAVAPGVLVFGLVFLAVASKFSGGLAFWRRGAWA